MTRSAVLAGSMVIIGSSLRWSRGTLATLGRRCSRNVPGTVPSTREGVLAAERERAERPRGRAAALGIARLTGAFEDARGFNEEAARSRCFPGGKPQPRPGFPDRRSPHSTLPHLGDGLGLHEVATAALEVARLGGDNGRGGEEADRTGLTRRALLEVQLRLVEQRERPRLFPVQLQLGRVDARKQVRAPRACLRARERVAEQASRSRLVAAADRYLRKPQQRQRLPGGGSRAA